jgi:hypothetical protein
MVRAWPRVADELLKTNYVGRELALSALESAEKEFFRFCDSPKRMLKCMLNLQQIVEDDECPNSTARWTDLSLTALRHLFSFAACNDQCNIVVLLMRTEPANFINKRCQQVR